MMPLLHPPALTQGRVSNAVVPADLPGVTFHSGFWLNLHQVLFEQARRQRAAQGAHLWGPPPIPLGMDTASLPSASREAWTQAVDFYAARYADRDLLFDDELARVKQILTAHEDDAALKGAGLPADLAAALNAAAPVYRAGAWPAQDRANRRWLADERPDLERLWPILAPVFARAFQSPWPGGPARVDLCVVANWAGAYTTEDPLHVVLATADPRDQAGQGLEIVFHEISHGSAGRLQEDLAREAAAQGRKIPEDLWHAVLFDTVGWALAHAMPGHRPYAEVQGLFDRGWPACRAPIEQAWRPWLEGKATYAEMVRALVERFPAATTSAQEPPPAKKVPKGEER